MEQIVIAELNRRKEQLREKIKRDSGLSDLMINNILDDVDLCLGAIMKLMKDGKSVHEKFFSDIILNSIDACNMLLYHICHTYITKPSPINDQTIQKMLGRKTKKLILTGYMISS